MWRDLIQPKLECQPGPGRGGLAAGAGHTERVDDRVDGPRA